MTVHKLSRREALRGTGVAALAIGAAVVPIIGARAMAPGGELTALIQIWREHYNRLNFGPAVDDKAANEALDTMLKLVNSMIGVPVRSRAEAVKAIDLVFDDSNGCMIDFSHSHGIAYEWLLKSARDYIAEEVRS